MKMAILFAGLSDSLAQDDPPGFNHRGSFFYAQVNYEPKDTIDFYTTVQLGCNDFTQKWVISTHEESVGYVTTVCQNDG